MHSYIVHYIQVELLWFRVVFSSPCSHLLFVSFACSIVAFFQTRSMDSPNGYNQTQLLPSFRSRFKLCFRFQMSAVWLARRLHGAGLGCVRKRINNLTALQWNTAFCTLNQTLLGTESLSRKSQTACAVTLNFVTTTTPL